FATCAHPCRTSGGLPASRRRAAGRSVASSSRARGHGVPAAPRPPPKALAAMRLRAAPPRGRGSLSAQPRRSARPCRRQFILPNNDSSSFLDGLRRGEPLADEVQQTLHFERVDRGRAAAVALTERGVDHIQRRIALKCPLCCRGLRAMAVLVGEPPDSTR